MTKRMFTMILMAIVIVLLYCMADSAFNESNIEYITALADGEVLASQNRSDCPFCPWLIIQYSYLNYMNAAKYHYRTGKALVITGQKIKKGDPIISSPVIQPSEYYKNASYHYQ